MAVSQEQGDLNRSGFITFIASMIFTFVFFGYLVFIYQGVDIGELRAKTAVETQLAGGGGAGAAGAAVDVSSNQTPWESSTAMVAHGESVYKANCAFCHGNTGKGDGPAGATLIPKPRDLVAGKWKVDGSTIGLFKTLKNGIPGTSMAAFGHLPVIDRWAMVHYMQSITKNKVMSDAAKLEAFGKAAK